MSYRSHRLSSCNLYPFNVMNKQCKVKDREFWRLTIFLVGRPDPCPAFVSMRAIIGLDCGLFSKLVQSSYCNVCLACKNEHLIENIHTAYWTIKNTKLHSQKDQQVHRSVHKLFKDFRKVWEMHTASSFKECRGTTRSSWSAVRSMVEGYWTEVEPFSHGRLTLCNGEYLNKRER